MDEIEVKASTVEAAIKKALEALDATLDEVDTQILDSGSPGRMLGFGARDAVVLVTRRREPHEFDLEGGEDADEELEDESRPRRRRRRRPRRGPRRRRQPASDESAAPASTATAVETQPRERPKPEPMSEEAVEEAREFVAELLDRMGYAAEVDSLAGDPPVLNISASDGQDMAALIGSRGDTLRQFGFLVSSMLGRRMDQSVRIVIDVDNYRRRREDSIRELAMEAADAVRETGRTVTLRVMPGHERRIVHLALAEDEEVHTYSIGQNRSRRVVIALRE